MKWYYIVIILFSSCQKPEKISICGKYISERPTKIELLNHYVYEGARRSILGQELQLNHDNTYTYKACGIITSGTWTLKNDKLVFEELSKYWINDNLNEINKPFSNDILGFYDFQIKENKLVSFFTSRITKKKMINQLHKVSS